ncbi:MAG: hypothetical protein VKP62_01560 [Candidatus Sericytochromatia bacterium]|nr:hypothetical protein [Candidatus Sericytochromatia bacterium]
MSRSPAPSLPEATTRLLSVRSFQWYATLVASALLLWLYAIMVGKTGGRLIYTLDDPYIHLALAENILRGSYGVNLGELCAPSSSILFPFLLTLPLAMGWGDQAPLLYIVPATLGTVWLMAGLVWQNAGPGFGRLAPLAFLVIPPALILALNSLALMFTGMEHPLHVLGMTMFLTGLYQAFQPGGRPTLAACGIALCALIRFEGLAIAPFGLVALYLAGHRKTAWILGGGLAGVLGAYASAMWAWNLPLLPSSVLTKSLAATSLSEGHALVGLKTAIWGVYSSLETRTGALLALAALLFTAGLFQREGHARPAQVIQGLALLTIGAHLCAGHFGFFARYEAYVVATALCAVFLIPRDFGLGRGALVSLTSVLGILLVTGLPYFALILHTPPGSLNIYQQQYQMHRFATEYFPEPVAINDLGWVAFQNDQYVLDFIGLGSERARLLTRAEGRTVETLQRLVREHHIAYAMIYDSWFPNRPPSWRHVATLQTIRVLAASDKVAFYLIAHDQEARMRAALQAFAKTLPPGASLTLTAPTP